MQSRILIALSLTLAATAPVNAGPDHAMPAKAVPKELETLKKLVGTWQGQAKTGSREVPVTIVYESTAGGTAVLERLFPGTPHEMTSVYTAEGDKVVMTHYCALGNHPKMTLKKADARSLAFEMAGTDGLRSASEPHMHAMTVSFVDGDHIREVWTSYDNGAKKEDKAFELARKK
ncbi:MAG TPA: hypothetical protein VN914_14645 [Polyangia bacterium]|nr:hypothetical protein [Polyangia bacterium]